MINITSSTIVVDGRAPLDTADPPAPTAPPTHEALAAALPDPVTAFAANFGLHPDVADYADPKKDPRGPAMPLEAKKDKPSLGNPPPTTTCKPPASSYDVNAVSDAEITELRRCGHGRLADTIVNAKASYADLLAAKPPIKIRVLTSAGNGGQPVMVVTGPKFKPDADVHVHTHYHGDNATVADPLGSKAGINARIRATILKGDTQAMFVLPEAANSPSKVDSPDHDLKYPVHWTNVSDQVKTVDDALAAAKVGKSAVTERVVSAHSGGGMALNNLINADLKGGTRLQADRLELYDCLYHFHYWVAEKVVDGKTIEGHFVSPAEWHTDKRLEMWSGTPNGQAVKHVTFFRVGSDDGTRTEVVKKAFPPDGNGHARFKKVDESDEPGLDHYRTVGQHLGERPKP